MLQSDPKKMKPLYKSVLVGLLLVFNINVRLNAQQETIYLQAMHINANRVRSSSTSTGVFFIGPIYSNTATAAPSAPGSGGGSGGAGAGVAGSVKIGTNGQPCLQIEDTGQVSGQPARSYMVSYPFGQTGVYVQQISTTVKFQDGTYATVHYTEAMYVGPTTHVFPDTNKLPQGLTNARGAKQVSAEKLIVATFVPNGHIDTSKYQTLQPNSSVVYNGALTGVPSSFAAQNPGFLMPLIISDVGSFAIREGKDDVLFSNNSGQTLERSFTNDVKDGTTTKGATNTSAGNGC